MTNNPVPYQQAYYPPTPTRLTQYLRTSIAWQFLRFLVINVKIVKVMLKPG